MRLLKTWRIRANRVFAETFGGIMENAAHQELLIDVTYGVAPIINAALGNLFVMSITDNVAFIFGVPTNPPPTGVAQVITITNRNISGGAHGGGTFDAIFKVSAGVQAMATATSQSITFRWDGTNWVEIGRTAADVAN